MCGDTQMTTPNPSGFAPQIGRSISLEGAAKLLGVSRRTIYNRIREGRLQTIRTLGGSQRVLLASVGQEICLDESSQEPDTTMASVRRVARSAMVAAALLSLAVPSFAERARLSADLADHLAAGSQPIDVIVQGNKSAVEGLASRYAVAVKRRLKTGAVLRVNAGQLDAIARDGGVDVLSGDVPIRPAMAVTNTSIGADQVWDGVGGGRGLTGKGVTVAVIDSGIDGKHNALKGRVVAAVDCLQECGLVRGASTDPHGHGTHVAAIIAGQAGRGADARSVQGV